jgi:hypothetical protein
LFAFQFVFNGLLFFALSFLSLFISFFSISINLHQTNPHSAPPHHQSTDGIFSTCSQVPVSLTASLLPLPKTHKRHVPTNEHFGNEIRASYRRLNRQCSLCVR